MDILSLYYFREAAKDLHVTKTANRLFISQQSLSAHIQRLEEYYKVQLMNRRPKITLTRAGEHMVQFADAVLQAERILIGILSDEKNQNIGTIKVGASSPRSNTYLPHILQMFSAKYPNIKVEITDAISVRLEQMLLEGNLDMFIGVGKAKHATKLTQEFLFKDPLYYCISDVLLKKHFGKKAEQIKKVSLQGASLKQFAEVPFFALDLKSKLGQLINECFLADHIKPNVYVSTTYTIMALPLCNDNLCGCCISQMNLQSWFNKVDKHVNVFPLYSQGKPVYLDVFLATYASHYQPAYEECFVQLLKSYFERLLSKNLSKLGK